MLAGSFIVATAIYTHQSQCILGSINLAFDAPEDQVVQSQNFGQIGQTISHLDRLHFIASSSTMRPTVTFRPLCSQCRLPLPPVISLRRGYHAEPDSFPDMEAELLRRKRKTDAKRRQGGSEFIDHLIVTVRGGELRPNDRRRGSWLIDRQGRIWRISLHSTSIKTGSRYPVWRERRSRRQRLPQDLSTSHFTRTHIQTTHRRARLAWRRANEARTARRGRHR